jgi:Leucine-rich repeat (LRR) protein
MTRIFKPDPVMAQKDRVRAALSALQETRRAVNDPDAVPQRLDAIIQVAWTVTETIGPEIVTHIDAVVVELEGLPFPVEGDEPLRGLENATLALQGALGTLKRAAMNVGYEAPEPKDLPRIPRAVVVDELEVIKSRLDTLSLEIKQIKLQQADEQENDSPPGQAPIVNKVVEKVELNIEIMSVKIDGQLIDIEGLSTLTGNVASLLVSFADAVSQLGPRVSKWLVNAAKQKLRPAAITFVDLGRGLVTKAQTWIKGRRAVEEELSAPREQEIPTPEVVLNPGTPPDDFDLDKVREDILAGREPKPEWRPWVTALNLADTNISSLAPLRNLANLLLLNLNGTRVANIESIKQLVNLRYLYLSDTEVADIAPIKELINLQYLDLGITNVVDIRPIKDLVNLEALFLPSTHVTNLDPLRQLLNLQILNLWKTNVDNIEPISQLQNLQNLDLSSTQVVDIEPLRRLMKLQSLYLSNTQVSNIKPINQLINLQILDLMNSKVVDIEPLKHLFNLQYLDLASTPINDVYPINQLFKLKSLFIQSTSIYDISSLKNLLNLENVYVEENRVSGLARTLGRKGIVKVQ